VGACKGAVEEDRLVAVPRAGACDGSEDFLKYDPMLASGSAVELDMDNDETSVFHAGLGGWPNESRD
jgi:hypothetical protein